MSSIYIFANDLRRLSLYFILFMKITYNLFSVTMQAKEMLSSSFRKNEKRQRNLFLTKSYYHIKHDNSHEKMRINVIYYADRACTVAFLTAVKIIYQMFAIFLFFLNFNST